METLRSIGPLALMTVVSALAVAQFAKVGAAIDSGPQRAAVARAPASGPVAVVKPAAPPAPEPPVSCTMAYAKVELNADPDGHFRPIVEVNGTRLTMLVDTGATLVSISAEHAKAIGLTDKGTPVTLKTAAGMITASKRTLRRMTVDRLTLCYVDAVVLPPSGMAFFGGGSGSSLLGLSFLRRIAGYAVHSNRLVLSP